MSALVTAQNIVEYRTEHCFVHRKVSISDCTFKGYEVNTKLENYYSQLYQQKLRYQ